VDGDEASIGRAARIAPQTTFTTADTLLDVLDALIDNRDVSPSDHGE